MKIKWDRICAVLFISILIAPTGFSQDSTTAKKQWRSLLEPYLIIPSMKGNVGLGDLPDAEIDADAGDIFGHLKMGAMLYFEVYNDRWAFSSDILYFKLGQDIKSSTLIQSGDVVAKQFGLELAALRKLLPWLEAGIGGRYNNITSGVDLIQNNVGGGTTARSKELSKGWFDPIIISRIKFPLEGKWLLNFRGDIGGFGVGSDFAWQIQLNAGYRFSKLFQFSLGYRVISMDFEDGSGQDRFLYDITTLGPVLRFGFNL